MNFKKNQRRIPMNFKKIIPLMFTALSVVGALSACSDSAVVGADVQGNSIALSSSSGVEPGSSNSLRERGCGEMALAAIRDVRKGAAVAFVHMAGDTVNQIDSVTAHESYDRAVQSILDYDVTIDTHAEYVIKFDTVAGFAFNSSINAMMRDEEDVVHEATLFVDNAPWGYSVNCSGKADHSWERSYEINPGDSYWFGDTSVVVKALRSSDSALLEQFRQDCALENGRLYETTGFDYPEAHCMVPLNLVEGAIVDGPETYRDPNWKKYATGVLEGCVTTIDFDDMLRSNDSIFSSSSVALPIDVEIFNANSGTAKTMSYMAGEPFEGSVREFYQYIFPIDSVNANETFNRTIQSIYDAGTVVLPLQENPTVQNLPMCKITNFFMLDEAARQVAKQNASPEDYEACVALEKYELNNAKSSVTFAVMKDNEGMFHGPIVLESQYYGYRTVNCYVQALGVTTYGVGNITEDHNHHKNLMTSDSALAEEFKKDCASENGEFTDETMYSYEVGTRIAKVEYPRYAFYCSFQYTVNSDGVLTYSDPNWEKYAKHIVESCVSTTYDTSVYK